MKPLLAFPHNDKQMYLARVKKHREADELVRGTGWDGRRGCAVGCTLECYDHSKYPELLGVPEVLARLEDTIFENLPDDLALNWPERFLTAIEPGSNLDGVWPQFTTRMLRRCLTRIGSGGESWRTQCRAAVETVITIYEGQWPHNEDEIEAARFAAWDAAYAPDAAANATRYAANAARYAANAAWDAAYAPDAAANAARYAANAARYAADAAANAADAADAAANAADAAGYAANAAGNAANAADAAGNAAYAADAAYAERIQQAYDLIQLIMEASKTT